MSHRIKHLTTETEKQKRQLLCARGSPTSCWHQTPIMTDKIERKSGKNERQKKNSENYRLMDYVSSEFVLENYM
jgi:hypothetical protein